MTISTRSLVRSIAVSSLRAGRQLFGRTGLRRNPTLRRLYGYCVDRLRSGGGVIEVRGHHMRLDAHDSLGLSVTGRFGRYETELLERLIRPGDVVLDLGANIGYYTLIFARSVGPSGTVIAFEPDPSNFALLQENVARNGYTNVVALNVAASATEGHTTLYVNPYTAGDHRIYSSHDGRTGVPVRTARIDATIRAYANRVDLVKMDIQGAEGLALTGMREMLGRNQRLAVLLEFWPYGLRLAGSDPLEVLRTFSGNDWQVRVMDGERETLTLLEDPTDVLRGVDITVDGFARDLFCTRGNWPQA